MDKINHGMHFNGNLGSHTVRQIRKGTINNFDTKRERAQANDRHQEMRNTVRHKSLNQKLNCDAVQTQHTKIMKMWAVQRQCIETKKMWDMNHLNENNCNVEL